MKVAASCFVLIASLTLAANSGQSLAESPEPIPENLLNLLRIKSVQIELELVDFQIKTISELHAKVSTTIATSLRSARQLSTEERRDALAQLKRDIADLESVAFNALLPHQRDRLRQIALQSLTQSSQPTAGLLHKKTIEELKLTDEQTAAIRDKAKEAEARLKEKLDAIAKQVADAKETARNEVLTALTPEQRAQYEKLFGKQVDLQPGR